MTTTLPRPTDRPPAPAADPPPLRRRRTSRLLLLGVLLAVLGALLGAYAYRSAIARDGVVAMTRPLAAGATIGAGDVREVLLPADTGLVTIPWSEVDAVVGRMAATELRGGQTLTPDAVTTERVPGPGEAVVGLAVEAGRVPVTPLAARDAVLIVTGTDGPPRRAMVVRAGEPDVSGRRTVDVLVAQNEAAELALASVEGRVAIVLVGR